MLSLHKHKLLGSAVPLDNRAKMVASNNFTSSTNIVGQDFSTGMLEGFVPKNNPAIINNLYREIYLMDPISGPTVDIMSTLPWSPFSLSGFNDDKIMKVYESSVAELGLSSLMVQLSVSYLVLGVVIGSLLFDEKQGIFTDLLQHNPDNCELTPIPLRGYDPKIDLKLDASFKKFLSSNDPRDKEALKEIPPELFGKLSKGSKIQLEPLNTLYLERSYVPGIERVSYYSRILPIWLVEKALTRGTIIGAWRRQRSILHVTAGTDEWEPADEQLDAISSLFQNADQDPQGAIIVTRPGIETNEIRNGSDFWRVTEDADAFSSIKMRALGINEGFLSGDANYNTADVAMSVFIENLKAFRNFMTQAVVLDKIFLTIAKYHGFKKRTTAEINHNVRLSGNSDKGKAELDGSAENARKQAAFRKVNIIGAKNLAESAKYLIPKVVWQKELKTTNDQSLIDMYKTAEEKGIPVPLVYYASATGINIEDIANSFSDDIELRKEIKAHTERLKSEGLLPKGDSEGSGGDSGDMFASVSDKNRKARMIAAAEQIIPKIPDEILCSEDSISSFISYVKEMHVHDKKTKDGKGKKRNPLSLQTQS